MTGANRLPAPFGTYLDRAGATLPFRFDGRRYRGLPGDTLASALAANDVWLLARSFKYHRARGSLSFAGHDANALVQGPGAPNLRADTLPLVAGLTIEGQHYSGSLADDRDAWIERLARFLPVGFYYKAFYRPGGIWPWWERRLRQRAGLGRVAPDHPHAYHDKQYLFADVAVIGGGQAGMEAALTAAAAGADVLLVDDQPRLGGALLYTMGPQGRVMADALARRVAAEPRIRVLPRAACSGWFADHYLPVLQGRRLYKLRARATVVATGEIGQPAIFRNNDLPGILLGSAAQRLIHLYGVRPGRRAVVLAGNDEGYRVAEDLARAGVAVAAVADLRPEARPEALARLPGGTDHLPGHGVWEAMADPARHHLMAVRLAPLVAEGRAGPVDRVIAADLLCVSVGAMPAFHLLAQAGAVSRYDNDSHTLLVGPAAEPGVSAAGLVAGQVAPDAVAAGARRAGQQAAAHCGFGEAPAAAGTPADAEAAGRHHPYPCLPHPRGKDFVDLDEDLTVADIRNGIADGFEHIELLKRYTTVGMGPSQGRTSALATIRLTARATGRDAAAIGTTTARPPVVPETMGQLAGRGFEPGRRTPMHHRHLEAGAQMMTAGLWWRPAFYGPAAERESRIAAEVRAVRGGVGLIDVSTLGGLEVRGPDAAEFLERICTFAYARQPVGRIRYVLTCDQTGAIVDDGVACRLGERHFYVTATTGGVDGVYRQMLWWNAQWRLDVDVTNVTAAWCGLSLSGPLSRRVLARLCPGLDLSADGFPYLAVREGLVADIPCRLLRVGFVGELGWEIHAPYGAGEALWDALLNAGTREGIRPVGVEAQRVLRLEKGHIIIGQDTDGLTLPSEAAMGWAVSRRKPFFVGGRAIGIQEARPPTRVLAGFVLADAAAPMPEESHLVLDGTAIAGRVTSIARSPTLGRIIGLAYVAPHQAVPGSRFPIQVGPLRWVEAETVALPFYDPDNLRQAL